MDVPYNSLKVSFVEAGCGRWGRAFDGYVHRKTVPNAIVAQVTMGRYEVAVGDGPAEMIETGEAFLTPPNVPLVITHHCDPRSGVMTSRWVHFNFTVYDTLDLSRFLRLPLCVEERWASRFGEISDELRAMQSRGGNELAASARRNELSFKLLAILCEYLSANDGLPEATPGMNRLLPALDHARRHLDAKLTVNDLAKRVGLSTPRFHAEFRKWFGDSPLEHVRKMRLGKACDLLRGTDMSLEQAAQETGFCNQFHLSREFKKAYGKPPSLFRQSSRDGFVV